MIEGTLVVLSGPSGAGKTTLVRRALERLEDLTFSVSVTTRPRRRGERDGVDYRFVDEDDFAALVAAGELLEHALVHGHHYGTPREAIHELQRRGKTVLLDIDTQGADQVRASGEPATFVFVMPPDHAALRRRLARRATEDPETVRRRLAAAWAEMERARDYEFVVVNDDVERAAEELVAILRAARIRGAREQLVDAVLGSIEER